MATSIDNRHGPVTRSVIHMCKHFHLYLSDVDEGTEKREMIDSHVTNLVGVITDMPVDLPDSTEALGVVREYEAMLGPENVLKLKTAMSRSAAPQKKRLRTKTTAMPVIQQHLYIEDYLPDSLWTFLRASTTIGSKIIHMAQFCCQTLGLHFPNERTYPSIVGVILAAHQQNMDFSKAHDYLE